MGASTAKLSPDGKHVGFSDLRSDSVLNMVVAKLSRAGDKYQLTDPRVINPPGPTSTTDTSVAGWSDSSALYEFKSFTHGGADATYVQVGGINRSPDVWSVNLKTGKVLPNSQKLQVRFGSRSFSFLGAVQVFPASSDL